MGSVQLFWTTYMRKVHIAKNSSLVHQKAEIWAFEIQIAPYKPAYLVLVHLEPEHNMRV